MNIERERRPEPVPGAAVTGVAAVTKIAGDGAGPRVSVNIIEFAPGARTAWHSHPHGQTLFVLGGRGLVQARGGERTEVGAGDVIHAPPGEEHWHGAAPGEAMTHLAIAERRDDGTEVVPPGLRPVSDAEYSGPGPGGQHSAERE